MLVKKKFLYLITLSDMGGAQKYVFDLATNLDKQNFEVAVAAGGDGQLFRQLESTGVKIFKLKWLRRSICPICDTLAYFEIKKLLKLWQLDVLHLNSSKAAILGSLAARTLRLDSENKIKVTYTVHGSVFEASFSWLAKKLFLWLERLTAKYKDKIICVSEYDRQLWLRNNVAPIEKLITIHNGIDLNIDFLSKEQARQKLLAKYNPDFINYQIVGWLGYLYPEKNLATLIEAASLILNNPKLQNKKILFVIIGDGPQQESLKLKVKSFRPAGDHPKGEKLQDKILFLDAIPQAWRYLKAFDIFTLPSVKEGLPYTILEAMAAGVPIVASGVGGIPEIVQKNGINGFLIKPRDAEALAERILQILENPELAQRFSQASLDKIKEFSVEKMLYSTQQQY